MRRASCWISLLIAALTLCGAATVSAHPPAKAVAYPPGSHGTGALLADWWTGVLEQPAPDNPFLGGGNMCLHLRHGRVVGPVPQPDSTVTCSVKPGTKVLVIGFTVECSTVEDPPAHATDPEQGRQCAREGAAGAGASYFTLDGGPRIDLQPDFAVDAPWTTVTLPTGNILNGQPGTASFAAFGVVALLHPLPPGEHVIHLVSEEPGGVTHQGDIVIDVVAGRHNAD
jgi:hypothetical protein